MNDYVIKPDVYDSLDEFRQVNVGDTVDPMYGYRQIGITGDDLNHLLNGGCLYHTDGEYARVIALRDYTRVTPPDDARQIVHCSECILYGGREWENYESGICARTDCGVGKDDYCSYGVTHE